MKKHLPLILSAVACLLAAVCLWRIVLLEQAVEEQISELRTLDSSVVDLQSLPVSSLISTSTTQIVFPRFFTLPSAIRWLPLELL